MKFLLVFLVNILCFAQNSLTVVAVGEAEVVAEKILVESVRQVGANKELNNLPDIIKNDFRFYQNFFNVEKASTLSDSFSSHNYSAYKSAGQSYVVKMEVNQNSLSYKVLDASKEREMVSASMLIISDVRRLAHRISYEAYKAITQKEPIFLDKILFVSDYRMRNGIKELYMVDFDGANIKRLTFHNGLVISPAVSPDGKKVLYSLIDERIKGRDKNINLMLLDLETNQISVISNKNGINSGAVFSEDGQSIFLTLSHQGNAEIYRMNLATKELLRLTRNGAPDVDPSINRDGSLMTFLSGRPGNPMIYTMAPSSEENNVKRISFVGQFNATPRFSPDGREIVFASWLDERFDLFKINSDGSGLGRLTKDFGSNEDPDYSKDGQFILFTNQRVISRTKAVQNLYIMDREGKIIGNLTQEYGKCISPRWVKSLN